MTFFFFLTLLDLQFIKSQTWNLLYGLNILFSNLDETTMCYGCLKLNLQVQNEG